MSGDYLADLRIRIEPGPGVVASLRGVLLVVPTVGAGQEEALDALLSAAAARPVVRGVARVVADFDAALVPAFCLVVEGEQDGPFALAHGPVVLSVRGDGQDVRLSGTQSRFWVDHPLPASLEHLSVRLTDDDAPSGGRLVLEATASRRPESRDDTPDEDTPSSVGATSAPTPAASGAAPTARSAPPEPAVTPRDGDAGRPARTPAPSSAPTSTSTPAPAPVSAAAGASAAGAAAAGARAAGAEVVGSGITTSFGAGAFGGSRGSRDAGQAAASSAAAAAPAPSAGAAAPPKPPAAPEPPAPEPATPERAAAPTASEPAPSPTAATPPDLTSVLAPVPAGDGPAEPARSDDRSARSDGRPGHGSEDGDPATSLGSSSATPSSAASSSSPASASPASSSASPVSSSASSSSSGSLGGGSSSVGFRPEPIRFGEDGRMETVAPPPAVVNGWHEPPAGPPSAPTATTAPPAPATSAPAGSPPAVPAAPAPASSPASPPAPAPAPAPSPFARPTPPDAPEASGPPSAPALPVRRPQASIPPQAPTQLVGPPAPGMFPGTTPPPVSPGFDPFGAVAPRPPESGAAPGRRPSLGRLVMENGPDVVVDTDCVIGRNPEVDPDVATGRAKPIVLPDAEQRISRVHARLVFGDHGVEIVDAGSVNGTWIEPPDGDGWIAMVPRVPSPLPLGSRIQVGDLVLSYSPLEGEG